MESVWWKEVALSHNEQTDQETEEEETEEEDKLHLWPTQHSIQHTTVLLTDYYSYNKLDIKRKPLIFN